MIAVSHKKTTGMARKFLGTLEDAEDVKTWAEGTEVSWAPVDSDWAPAIPDEGYFQKAPDLSKGVTLEVFSYLGYQSAETGDWLVRDESGVAVYQQKQFEHYFAELPYEESGAV